MVPAAVGHQCVDCVRQGAATVRPLKTQFGGRVRTGSAPIVTWTLIGMNVAVFIMQMATSGLVRDFSLWPDGIAVYDQWYRLITSAFLHDGTMHILFNMWALWVLGPPLEAALGRLRYGLLYGLSLLGGSVLVYLLSAPNTPTIGASGAIFGLFGAAFIVGRRMNLDVRWVLGLIAINLVFTVVAPAISWQGHLGGLLTGGLVAAAFAYAPDARRAAAAAGVTVGLLVVFAGLLWWRTDVLLSAYAYLG